MTNTKNIVITALVALVVSSAVGFYFVGKVQTDQSNLLGGLSERNIRAVSLNVGSPTSKFNVNSSGTKVGIGTTTPDSGGELVIDGTATTSVVMGSTASRGTCIQMKNSAGTTVRMYINSTSLVINTGTCR